ncbi:MAG: hypothetical protein AAGD22_04975 [Verrucomicrobiota bacterium]
MHRIRSMRWVGLGLVVLGFGWVLQDCFVGFVGWQHLTWVSGLGNLPAGESIPREEAGDAMRALALELKDRHRMVLLPAALMLIGSGILWWKSKPRPGE